MPHLKSSRTKFAPWVAEVADFSARVARLRMAMEQRKGRNLVFLPCVELRQVICFLFLPLDPLCSVPSPLETGEETMQIPASTWPITVRGRGGVAATSQLGETQLARQR